MKIADRMEHIGTESAFEVLGVVKKLEAEGKRIWSFCIGEPDFDTPANVKEAGMKAIRENKTHYAPIPGIMALRKAIAKHISETRNVDVLPEEVMVAPGGKPILYYAITSLVNPGEEVIYPNPGYPIYESVVDFVGGKAVPLPLLEKKDFRFDIEDLKRLVNENTKLVILNSPQNPTGGVLTREDLEAVAELAKKYDFYILSDEIYDRIIYDNRKFESIISIPGMKERTILANGHSKTYAMTGWRLGYGVFPMEMMDVVGKLANNIVSCTSTFIQEAGVEALTGPQDAVEEMVKEFDERRKLITELLNDIPGVHVKLPGGAFYSFPNVTEVCKNLGFRDARQLQKYLLYKGNVAVLYRECFGRRNEGETEEYLRLSYATSQQEIREGIAKMKEAIENKELVEEFLREDSA